MKKIFGGAVLASVLLGSGLTVSAEEQPTVKEFRTIETINGESVEVNGVKGSSVEVSTEKGISTRASGNRNWQVTNHRPLGFDWYTVAKASATYNHNKMGARARLYNGSGVHWASDNQSLRNTSSISATAKPGGFLKSFSGAYSIGNFTFERSGYENTYPEIRNNW